jgi:hypothetical protein
MCTSHGQEEHTNVHIKRVEIEEKCYVLAVHVPEEDHARAVESFDALLTQTFFYSAPMERQVFVGCDELQHEVQEEVRSVTSCSTTSGPSAQSAASAGSAAWSALAEEPMCDLLETVNSDNVCTDLVADRHCQVRHEEPRLQPVVEDEMLEFLEHTDIVAELNKEEGRFTSFPAAVLMAMAPNDAAGPASIVFCSDVFTSKYGLGRKDSIMTRCMFDLYKTTGSVTSKSVEELLAFQGEVSQCASMHIAADFQVRMHTSHGQEESSVHIKRIELEEKSYVLAVHVPEDDRARVVESFDALLTQTFFYSAPMERQTPAA